MHDQRCQRHKADKNSVPIEDARVCTERIEICPERLKKDAAFVQWNAANHIGHRRTEKDGEQGAAKEEHPIPERCPDRICDATAQFDGDTAKHQEPEDDDQRQIEAAEAGGVKQRKGEENCAASGD